MIIYSVTVNIDDEVHDDWITWMKEVHIPDVMKTGIFKENRMSRVLTTQDDESGNTYNIQYLCDSLDRLEEYQEKFAQELQKEHTERYKDKFVAFRTLLELVD